MPDGDLILVTRPARSRKGRAMSSHANQADCKSKILVVDDHPLFREGLATRLAEESDLEVCGEAVTVAQAANQLREVQPDIVVLDIALGYEDGLELLRRSREINGQIKVLVLSTYSESLYAERALRAGAMGYVNKQASWDVIVTAIRTLLDGRRFVSPELAERLFDQTLGTRRSRPQESVPAGPMSIVEALTDRELEVFRLLGEGLATQEVARRLFVSTHTVDSHRENIKRKLKLKNGSELKRAAILWISESR